MTNLNEDAKGKGYLSPEDTPEITSSILEHSGYFSE